MRLYDPDRHIIEVGEGMAKVARRFLDGGLSQEGWPGEWTSAWNPSGNY